MVKYDFTQDERDSLIAFFKWIGEADLNGFPPKPDLAPVATSDNSKGDVVAETLDRPKVFNQMCIACHQLNGQGGQVGPALDGVGSRLDAAFIKKWLSDPLAVKADTKMPKLPLSESDIVELTAFLSQLKEGR